MFLLRCVFWLSAVYAAMFFGLPWQLASHGATLAAVHEETTRVAGEPVGRAIAEQAVVGMAAWCAGRELDCARDAAGLTALVRTALSSEPDYAIAGIPTSRAPAAGAAPDAVPVPAADPRRRERLTRHP